MSSAGESIHVSFENVGVLLFLFLIGRGVDYLPQVGLSASGWIIGRVFFLGSRLDEIGAAVLLQSTLQS